MKDQEAGGKQSTNSERRKEGYKGGHICCQGENRQVNIADKDGGENSGECRKKSKLEKTTR